MILDGGPDPELPQTPEPVAASPEAFHVTTFEGAIDRLRSVMTKPLSTFARAKVSPDDIGQVAAFLHDVAPRTREPAADQPKTVLQMVKNAWDLVRAAEEVGPMFGWPDHADQKEQKKLQKRIAGIKNNLEMLVGDVAGIFGKELNHKGELVAPAKLPEGRGPDYMLARLDLEGHFDLAAQVRAGKMSAYAAAEQAGFLLKWP